MAFESVRGYVQLATGLGDLTRARATEAAQGLLALPGQAQGAGARGVAGQVSALADELLAAATTNRENLLALVRSEIDAAVLRLGLARASELAAAQERISVLRSQVAELRAAAAFAAAEQVRGAGSGADVPAEDAAASTTTRAPRKAAAKTPTTKKAAAKKSAAKKSAATSAAKKAAATSTARKSAKTTAKKSAARAASKKSAAKKTAAKTSSAKKSTAKAASKKSAAKKTAAKTSSAKKSTTRSSR